MAVKTRAELLAANAALFVSNITGDITPPLEKAYNDHEIDSFVNRFGDTFEPDAIFEFDNGSKLREGVIQHGYGGGIARVCANDKTDQWEDGVRYLTSTTGSTNTVVYAESINNVIPDDTYDVTLGYAVGSRFKNLVTGVEYLCNNADEDGAIWIPLVDEWFPTITGGDTSSLISARYSVQANIVTFTVRFEVTNAVTVSNGVSITIEYPYGLTANALTAQSLLAVWSDRYPDIYQNGWDEIVIDNGGPAMSMFISMGAFTVTERFEFTISGQYLL